MSCGYSENMLSNALFDSIKDNALDCLSDIVEIGLDAITEDDTLKSIPVVSTAISVFNIGKSIKERYTLKKFAAFLEEIRNGTCNEEKREKYLNKFQENKRERNKELEYLLILIDRYLSTDKAIMLAKLYLAFLDDTINWDEFCTYAETIDRFLPGDFEYLKNGLITQVSTDYIPDSLLRLIAYGLMVENEKAIKTPTTLGEIIIPVAKSKEYKITSFGSKLLRLLCND